MKRNRAIKRAMAGFAALSMLSTAVPANVFSMDYLSTKVVSAAEAGLKYTSIVSPGALENVQVKDNIYCGYQYKVTLNSKEYVIKATTVDSVTTYAAYEVTEVGGVKSVATVASENISAELVDGKLVCTDKHVKENSASEVAVETTLNASSDIAATHSVLIDGVTYFYSDATALKTDIALASSATLKADLPNGTKRPLSTEIDADGKLARYYYHDETYTTGIVKGGSISSTGFYDADAAAITATYVDSLSIKFTINGVESDYTYLAEAVDNGNDGWFVKEGSKYYKVNSDIQKELGTVVIANSSSATVTRKIVAGTSEVSKINKIDGKFVMFTATTGLKYNEKDTFIFAKSDANNVLTYYTDSALTNEYVPLTKEILGSDGKVSHIESIEFAQNTLGTAITPKVYEIYTANATSTGNLEKYSKTVEYLKGGDGADSTDVIKTEYAVKTEVDNKYKLFSNETCTTATGLYIIDEGGSRYSTTNKLTDPTPAEQFDAAWSKKENIKLETNVTAMKDYQFDYDVVIDLNGYTLDIADNYTDPVSGTISNSKSFQANTGRKITIINSKAAELGSPNTGTVAASVNLANTDSALVIEDNVAVSSTSNTAVTGKGSVIITGASSITGTPKAVGTEVSVDAISADYRINAYNNLSAFIGTVDDESLAATNGVNDANNVIHDAVSLTTEKIHRYNADGFEVETRFDASRTVNENNRAIASSKNYTVTADGSYDYQRPTVNVNVASKTVSFNVASLGNLFWAVDYLNAQDDALDYAIKQYNDGLAPATPKVKKEDLAVTINIKADLDFTNAPAGLVYTPVNGAQFKSVTLDGAQTAAKGSVLENIKVVAGSSAAGLVSSAKDVTVTNLGLVNATVTASASEYAGGFVGKADKVTINNAFVNGISGTGKLGAFAGFVGEDTGSTMAKTYAVVTNCSPVYEMSTTFKNILRNPSTGVIKVQTNYYDMDVLTKDVQPTHAVSDYFVKMTTEQFASGMVAFKLNKNGGDLETAGVTIIDSSKSPSLTNLTTVADYDAKYNGNAFGQILAGSSAETYPMFANSDKTNRVYQQLIQICKPELFANYTSNLSNSIFSPDVVHDDSDSDGICNTCRAVSVANVNAIRRELATFGASSDDLDDLLVVAVGDWVVFEHYKDAVEDIKINAKTDNEDTTIKGIVATYNNSLLKPFTETEVPTIKATHAPVITVETTEKLPCREATGNVETDNTYKWNDKTESGYTYNAVYAGLDHGDEEYTVTSKKHELVNPCCNEAPENHDFRVIGTIGNTVIGECTDCGFVSSLKTASAEAMDGCVLTKVEGAENPYVQKYSFGISGGSFKIESYGVLYNKEGNRFVTPTVDPVTGEIITDEAHTTRRTIKSSGTYTVSIGTKNIDDSVSVMPYVIYNDGYNYQIVCGKTVGGNFAEYAEEEAKANCSMTLTNASVVSEGVASFTSDIAVDAGYTLVGYGYEYTKTSTGVPAKEAMRSVVKSYGTYTRKIGDTRGVTANGYLVVRDSYGEEWTIRSEAKNVSLD